MITKYEEYIKENLDTKSKIENWLYSMYIRNYTINDDLTVDVNYSVSISHKNLTKIQVKFNKVNGNFYCHGNKLTSLEGCPSTIIGDFCCSINNLTSLEGCPNIVNGDFYCHTNPNLEHINDLDSKILIKSIDYIEVSQELYDKYFEYWIDKDSNIFEVLKDKISINIKQKYNHIFQANNFDLI